MLKLNVCLSRKIGEANFGSRGASVNLEVETTSDLENQPDHLQERLRRLFQLARAAVVEELTRPERAPLDGCSSTDQPGSNENGRDGHRATEKQLAYVRQLAGQIRGLGIRRLETLSQRMFGKPVAELTSLDASGLIDTLKAIKAGEINLESALDGAAP